MLPSIHTYACITHTYTHTHVHRRTHAHTHTHTHARTHVCTVPKFLLFMSADLHMPNVHIEDYVHSDQKLNFRANLK